MSYHNYPDLVPVDTAIKDLEKQYVDVLWDANDPDEHAEAVNIMRELDNLYAARERGDLYVPNF